MFEFTNVRHGALLNCCSGRESAEGLEFTVCGLCDMPGKLTVNGLPAVRRDLEFSCTIMLTGTFPQIKAEISGEFGIISREIKVVYDRNSFKRYDFYIDDHSFLFVDLAKERPASLFDHFYLKFLKQLHDRYGFKVTLNSFYRSGHEDFILPQCPDIWKGEWEDNADWLRLSFHAYSEFPDRPYQDASAEKLAADYDLVRDELVRIAGEKTFIVPEGIHWGMVRPEAFSALKARGVKMLSGDFILPSAACAAGSYCDVGYGIERPTASYLGTHAAWFDFANKIMFCACDCTCNSEKLEEIPEGIKARVLPRTEQIMSLSSHEQYSFPRYFNYQPDHLAKLEAAVKTAVELDYKPVFFCDGLLGNTATADFPDCI